VIRLLSRVKLVSLGLGGHGDTGLAYFDTATTVLQLEDTTFDTFIIVPELAVFKQTELSLLLHAVFVRFEHETTQDRVELGPLSVVILLHTVLQLV